MRHRRSSVSWERETHHTEVARRRVETFWCVNFETEPGVNHGLGEDLWLMQYQYAHGGYAFQGYAAQIASTSKNWNVLCGVHTGDWFVAYRPNKLFYAIGEVIERRTRPRHSGADEHVDTVERTVRDHRHRFFDGIVQYSDTAVLYEDFTDTWTCLSTSPVSHQPKMWQYPQRIDVREWEHVVSQGIRVDGLSNAAAFPAYRQAAFEIKESFFETVAVELRNACAASSV